MSDVSVLGLGLMGSSIAHTLIDKGYSVTVWNRTLEKAAPLTAAGGKAAFTAVEAVCTHEGCTVSNADGDQYVCPCHGSRYSRSGQVLRGPAVASLRRYTTSFTDGVVTIAV